MAGPENKSKKERKTKTDNIDHEEFYDPKAEWDREQEENIELEGKDVLALILSALLVFSPILLVLILILLWLSN